MNMKYLQVRFIVFATAIYKKNETISVGNIRLDRYYLNIILIVRICDDYNAYLIYDDHNDDNMMTSTMMTIILTKKTSTK